jgi:hypothetical protein
MVGQGRPTPAHRIQAGAQASGQPALSHRAGRVPAQNPGLGRAGQGRAGQEPAGRRGGRSPAGKSSQVGTRLAVQNGALGAAAESGRCSTSSSSPLWLAARSTQRRSRSHRRCHPSRPPPPELQPERSRAEPSRAEAGPPSARALASAAPPERGRGHKRPRPRRPRARAGRTTSLQGPPSRPAAGANQRVGKRAELCGTWTLPRTGRGRTWRGAAGDRTIDWLGASLKS